MNLMMFANIAGKKLTQDRIAAAADVMIVRNVLRKNRKAALQSGFKGEKRNDRYNSSPSVS